MNRYKSDIYMTDTQKIAEQRAADGLATPEHQQSNVWHMPGDYDPNTYYTEIVSARRIMEKAEGMSDKTVGHILNLLLCYGTGCAFGKVEVMEVQGLRSSAASDLLAKLLSRGIIAKAPEHGRGKYVFVNEI